MPGRAARSDVERRDTQYWQLMRSGLTNTAACTILGVTRRTGGRIRARHRQQTAAARSPGRTVGSVSVTAERLKIADLLALGLLDAPDRRRTGRSPSTVKRELDRHRDDQGRYLPRRAPTTARSWQRRRPGRTSWSPTPALRLLVQRKLNRCWSPDEISGWLRLAHPENHLMQLCPETIYRALLVPGGQGLHKRYCRKLRTGRGSASPAG